MSEQIDDPVEPVEEVNAPDLGELPREHTDLEKRLKRELARAREQAKIATNEREAGVAAAVRERDEAIAAIRSRSNDRVVQSELKAHAVKAGIIDLDGLRLADLSRVNVNEEGDVIGADAVIDQLRQEKPYLFTDTRPGVSTGTTVQTQRPPTPAAPMAVDARTLSREAWQAERDRLLTSGA